MSHPPATVAGHGGDLHDTQPDHSSATRSDHAPPSARGRAHGCRDHLAPPPRAVGRDPAKRVRRGGFAGLMGAGRLGLDPVRGSRCLRVASHHRISLRLPGVQPAGGDRGRRSAAPEGRLDRCGRPSLPRALRRRSHGTLGHPVCDCVPGVGRPRWHHPAARPRGDARRPPTPQALHPRRGGPVCRPAAPGAGAVAPGDAPGVGRKVAWLRSGRQ